MLTDNEGYTAQDTWDIQGLGYKVEMLKRAGLSIFLARQALVPYDDTGKLESLLCGH